MTDNRVVQIEQAKKFLLDFQAKLSSIEKSKDEGINVFNAVGMTTQEIKHSAFFAWLLNPEKNHGLKTLFLSKLLERLFVHNTNEQLNAKPNAEILAHGGIYSVGDLQSFCEAFDLTVETEKVINGSDSRIDIFIQSVSAKTVLIIENKVFTSTHDNQLKRYEEKLNGKEDWKKIFVYLTPQGDLPKNGEEYNDRWCIFSYQSVLDIIAEILSDEIFKRKENLKLKFLLEDYIQMVDTNILKGNKELRNLCRQIRREHREAIELLLAYTDNIEQVFGYCIEWVKNNVKGVHIVADKKRSFEFYTDTMSDFFVKNNEDILINEKRAKCRWSFGYSETCACGISLEKDGANWSIAQLKIKDFFQPDNNSESNYISLKMFSVLLESAKERDMEFEIIKPQIDERLTKFKDKIQEFENLLKTL